MSDASFLLDSNVFIEAHRRYYNQRICPGFWKVLRHYLGSPSALSIDKVRDELAAGKDALAEWVVKSLAPATFVASTQEPVIARYAELQRWAASQNKYVPAALHEFANADAADAWLVAFAKEHGKTIVTHEGNDLANRRKVLIPIVCHAFGVPVIDTFVMLHELEVKLDWAPKAV